MNNVAEKNDRLRTTFTGGRIMLSRDVQGSDYITEIIRRVRTYNDFTPSNDPYGEHDVGIFTIGEDSFMFKIDYYDDSYQFYQEDGNRVLTIMTAREY